MLALTTMTTMSPKKDRLITVLGVSTDLIGFGWDIAYTDSNSDGRAYYGEGLADGRIVFTLSKYL
ncbi:MAG: hypothetical protein ACI9QV_001494 [Methylophagaceae bacterium]|jgi:hypothetical protein